MNPNIIKDKVKAKIHSADAIPSFIRKTYDILEERKFPEVIDWNPEGTAIVIKTPSDFCQKVLPLYFKHNNLTSFVRQLNMYNFHKRRTQNIDHVYYHDLFLRGKKYLLKEIKRKSHDNASDKVQKLTETLDPSHTGTEFSSLIYENEFLKRLYNEARTKIAMLEGQVKDLSMQSQSLWAQLCKKNENEFPMKTLLARVGKQTSELTQEQLPMTFGEFIIPQINLGLERQPSFQKSNTFMKGSLNVNHYFNLGQDSESTEVSHSSPSLQPSMDCDKCFDFSDSTPFYPEEGLCFADQKVELQASALQPISQNTYSVLGKRPLDIENERNAGNMKFYFPEPVMKRPQELSIFNRRMISTGAEDKDILRTNLCRDSSINEEYDSNMTIDLMDFNRAFYA